MRALLVAVLLASLPARAQFLPGVLRPSTRAPRIAYVLPHNAAVGDAVHVYGENLDSVTEARVGTVGASFAHVSPNRIDVTIPTGAPATGTVGVRAGAGWWFSSDVIATWSAAELVVDPHSHPMDPRLLWDPSTTTPGPHLWLNNNADHTFENLLTTTSGSTIQAAGSWPMSLDMTVRYLWRAENPSTGAANSLTGYLWSIDNADGPIALRYNATGQIVLCNGPANSTGTGGSTCGTAGSGGERWATAQSVPFPTDGDEVEARVVLDNPYNHACTPLGLTGYEVALWLRINGAQFGKIVLSSNEIGCFVSSLNGPGAYQTSKDGWFGSLLGSPTGAFPVPITYASTGPGGVGQKHTSATSSPAFCDNFAANGEADEFVVIGDSNSANTAQANAKAIAQSIYTPEERWTRGGILSLAHSGDDIATQKFAWDTTYACEHNQARIKAVLVMIGTNDLRLDGHSAATVIADLQTFITDLRATTAAGTKIIVAELLPLSPSGVPNASVPTINAAITGGAITGIDYVVTATQSSKFNNGSGGWTEAYTFGDGVHATNAGRDIIAAAYRTALESFGLLP